MTAAPGCAGHGTPGRAPVDAPARAAPRRPRARAVLALLWLCAPAAAVERLSVSIADLEGPGWRAGDVELVLELARADAPRLLLDVGRLELPIPLHAFTAGSVRCAAVQAPGGALRCPAARLELRGDAVAPVLLEADVEVNPGSGALRVRVREQALLGGRVRLELRGGPSQRVLELVASGLDVSWLGPLVESLAGVAGVEVTAGRVDVQLRLEEQASGGRLDATLDAREVAFSDRSGLRAGEGLGLSLRVRADGDGAGWRGRFEAAIPAGAVYVHPLLLDVGDTPVSASASLRVADGGLEIADLELDDPGVLHVSGSARIVLSGAPRLAALELDLREAAAASLYRRYLQPFAGAGALSDLVVEGRVAARVSWREAGAARATLALHGLGAGDAGGRFALIDLDGELDWRRGQPPGDSRLAWRALQLGPLVLGPAQARLALHGREGRLLEPVETALLDGALRLERLEASALGLADQRVEADLSLRPLSLDRLSERLAWLPLAGRIAGQVPRLVLEDRRLAVEGELALDLFDGRVRVSGVSLEDPFGVVPRLRADIALHGIDLGLASRALSFGSVEGRLDGRIGSLVLERWQPVSFDAWFRTPEDDDSRHRISQRAVDNLASLGGANAVLSSTFLRIFSEFSYARLGVSCRLERGVCEMGGVAPAPRGYYLVEGGGLPPRVDVVGFNRRVDWETLVARLRAVAASSGPVVR